MREQEGQGATCILLAAALSVVGAFAIKDPLKPEAVGVVSALRSMGLQCYMVTGDNWTTARIVAAELGIINVMAEVLPAGKAEKVCAAASYGFVVNTWAEWDKARSEARRSLSKSGAPSMILSRQSWHQRQASNCLV